MVQVSVVMPVYNHANYVREALESVQAQTLHDIEIILVDDGSSDALDVVLRHISRDRLRIVKSRHVGLPAALNLGFRHVRGEYVTWTSADNVMLPSCLERLHAVLEAHPQYGAAYADYIQIDEWGIPIRHMSKGAYRIEKLMNFGPAFLMRARVAKLAGEFDPSLMGVEDRDHAMRVAMVAPVYWLPEVLYLYRVHDDSLSGRIRQRAEGWKPLLHLLRNKWSDTLRTPSDASRCERKAKAAKAKKRRSSRG